MANTGGTALTNVRVTAIQPSRPETQVLTPLPLALPDLGAGCGGTNSVAASSFRFRAGGLEPQSPLTFVVAVEADGLPGPVTGVLTIETTEADLTLGDVAFDFEGGAAGWSTASGTFTRSNLPPGGAQGSQWYMRSSSAANDACDRARSPKVRLTASSTLSLYNQFVTESEGDGENLPFYDRGNVGIVDASGRRTIVSPDGGRLYNAQNAYTGCNNGPGWATSLAQPVNTWAASSWSAAALGAAALAGQEVQVEVTYGTDAVQSLEGLQFDGVRLTGVLLEGPDQQPDACAAPPVAADDSATTPEDTPVTIAVLANDSDPNGDPLTVSAVSAPAHGAATTNGTTVTYTPAANYNGADAFTYQACDPSRSCDTATVTVQVVPVNDPPVAVPDSATVVKNRTVRIAVLANDGDPDGDALRVGGVTAPINGTASANADGTVTYTPRNGFVGADRFHYSACDPGGACSSARVDVLVQRKAGGGRDKDDFDDDAVRDDSDPDDDNDGAADGVDPDDDNDGTGDAVDDDDDEDGVGDEFDRQSSHETESFFTGDTAPGQHAEWTVDAGPSTLLLAVLAEAPGALDLRIEIRDPAGQVVGVSVPAPGRAVAVAPTLAPGTYRIRVRTVGTQAVAYSTTVVASTVW